ncbi:MAG TPA: ATP-binding protein [Gammaproteobacteria bacterium]|nr:ATP-binding protein [Gammaproteobacteria bacterium]
MMTIIGRVQEQKQLKRIFDSSTAEFVAVYGRRRIGKTHLVREFFKQQKCIFFRCAGIHKGRLALQLEKFKHEIETTFYQGRKGSRLSEFKNWHNAFQALNDAINLMAGTKKIIIFMDELPWMATPKSGLLEALDYYWNRHWSENKKIKLIICGSAASWIIENILNNTGGLHNRITHRLRIEAFNLAETKTYLTYKKCRLNNQQITALYLCIGGIPFYLNHIEKNLSAVQNINLLCFNKNGALHHEFGLLFASLFKHHELHEKIILLISKKREGIAREEIEKNISLKGGRLTKRLRELEEAGFIESFTPWGKERGKYYKIIDEFTLFYLTWIEKKSMHRIKNEVNDQLWESLSQTPAWKAWSGYAFEAICFKHLPQIKKALQIPSHSIGYSWRTSATKKDNGAQIDLVFDRPDNSINLCEIKYNQTPFIIDKKYAKHLQYRETCYLKKTNTSKQIFHSFITAAGLKTTLYSEGIIASTTTLDDLFT